MSRWGCCGGDKKVVAKDAKDAAADDYNDAAWLKMLLKNYKIPDQNNYQITEIIQLNYVLRSNQHRQSFLYVFEKETRGERGKEYKRKSGKL